MGGNGKEQKWNKNGTKIGIMEYNRKFNKMEPNANAWIEMERL